MRLLVQKLDLRHPCMAESDAEIAAAALPATLSLTELKAKGWVKTPVPRAEPRTLGQRLSIRIGLSDTDMADWSATVRTHKLA